MFDIFEPMELDSNEMCENKCAYGQGHCSIEVGGWREKPRHQSDQVADQDVKKDSGDVWEEKLPFRACDFEHEFLKATHDDFKYVLSFGRN